MAPKHFGLVALLILLTGCHHKAVIKFPVLKARTCPKNSVEVPAVNYCTDPPKCTRNVPLNSGEVCMAIDPATGVYMGVFFKGDSCNPFTEQDCDAPDKPAEKGGHEKSRND